MSDGTRIRLVGFNTPEKFGPQCSREAALGTRASERLRQLVASGKPTVTRVASPANLERKVRTDATTAGGVDRSRSMVVMSETS